MKIKKSFIKKIFKEEVVKMKKLKQLQEEKKHIKKQ